MSTTFYIFLIKYYEILPSFISNTTSATFMVDFLWETSTTVFLSADSFRDFRIMPSFRESRLDVGSSIRRKGLSWRKALAIPIRYFSPPERVSPSSPTSVSYPLGSFIIKSWMDALRAASMISSLDAPGLPIAILFAIESWNRCVSSISCLTDRLCLSTIFLPLSIPHLATQKQQVLKACCHSAFMLLFIILQHLPVNVTTVYCNSKHIHRLFQCTFHISHQCLYGISNSLSSSVFSSFCSASTS